MLNTSNILAGNLRKLLVNVFKSSLAGLQRRAKDGREGPPSRWQVVSDSGKTALDRVIVLVPTAFLNDQYNANHPKLLLSYYRVQVIYVINNHQNNAIS